jgi:hypothetical protein
MSNKRYDICTPRKGKDDKTFWTRIGTAWEGDKGIQLVFDALPLPDAEGRCVANLFEPKEKGSTPHQQPQSSGRASAYIDDDIPGF